MKIYSAVHRFCCGFVIVLGFGGALLMWPRMQLLVTFLLICFSAWFFRLVVAQSRSKVPVVGWSTWAAATRPAVRAGLGGVALGGLAEISIGLALLLTLIATATSSTCIAALRSRLQKRKDSLPIELNVDAPAVETHLQEVAREVDQACLRTLSNAELCLAWRRSYCSLQGATSVPLRAAVVASRQAYLDEMERRNPPGLSAWLAAGGRAPSGPERYFDDAR